MYKSVNVSQSTYQQLQRISTQLNKPKAQVVDALIREYIEAMKNEGSTKLAQFNNQMGAKIKALKFSKKIKVNTDNIDADFTALAGTDY